MESSEEKRVSDEDFRESLLLMLQNKINHGFDLLPHEHIPALTDYLFVLICQHENRIIRICVEHDRGIFIDLFIEDVPAQYYLKIEDMSDNGVSMTTFENNINELLSLSRGQKYELVDYKHIINISQKLKEDFYSIKQLTNINE